jgi:hypothetical protein
MCQDSPTFKLHIESLGRGRSRARLWRLSRDRHTKDRPNLLAIAHLSRRSAILFQPLREIYELDFVIDTNICDRHFDNVEPLGDSSNPFVGSNRCEPLSNGLIERGRRDFDGVRDAVHVLDRHAAGTDWHKQKISYSLFIRYRLRALPAFCYSPEVEQEILDDDRL